MHSRYFIRPYRFQAPDRRTIWATLARPYFGTYVRRAFGVQMADVGGLGYLQDSLDRGSGIVLAANHCRPADPLVLALAGARIRRYFYYLTSFHLFQQRRLEVWKLKRFGAMSVLRDTTDHHAMRASIEMLAQPQRPLVIFPEGTYFRQNDRLGPLQGGVSLICRRAARDTERPIVVHPVAIKYWFLGNAEAPLRRRIAHLERRFKLPSDKTRSPLERVLRITESALVLIERELVGPNNVGTLQERTNRLVDALLQRIEPPGDLPPRSTLLDRIRRLRRSRVNRLAQVAHHKDQYPTLCAELDMLYLCQLLFAQSPDYLLDDPTTERLAEAVQRLEEDWFDVDCPVAPMSAVVQIGPAIDARAYTHHLGEADHLTTAISEGISENLEQVIARGRPPIPKRRKAREFSAAGRGITLEQSLRRLRASAQGLGESQTVGCP